MYTGTCLDYPGGRLSAAPIPKIRESSTRHRQGSAPPGHGLAGYDLHALWDIHAYRRDPPGYGQAFMQRMHHPFHEVLACLYVNGDDQAVAYHSHFRGDKSSALAYVPDVARIARQLGCLRVLLAHNPFLPDPSRRPDYARLQDWLRVAGCEPLDLLLIQGGQAISLRNGVRR